MDTCIIKSPLGFTKIVGDKHGIASISILNSEEKTSCQIPDSLKLCIKQLQEYFDGDRTVFDLKLNPQGTDFQQSVW